MGKKEQIAYYENLLAKYGANYKALDWNSPESQKLRFLILKEIFIYGKKGADISVLDVGCGLGDLYGFFRSEGLLQKHKIRYTGYDISPKILDEAKKKYPEADFAQKDILEEKSPLRFDYVFCSGVYNIRTLDKEKHMEWVEAMLARMYDISGCGVAVNFLSDAGLEMADVEDINSGRYFLFKPDEILNICRKLCSRYLLRHDYHPGDFSVYLLK